jgi:pimeloyl-ACP methyl ester carboxylesterase
MGAMNDARFEVSLPQGTVLYRDHGKGPVLLFVHGLLVAGSVWRKVVPRLEGYRSIVPDLPLGAHTRPMNADADLSPDGVARIVASLMEALDLRDVTLVGNDTGGAICQIVAARYGQRVGRVVLTACDAFEVFPPSPFGYLKWVAPVPFVPQLLGAGMLAFPALRRLPIAFGLLAKRPLDEDVTAEWIRPITRDAGVRRDLRKFIRSVSPEVTQAIARELARVKKPFLLAWTREDRLFPMELCHRLAAVLPDAKVEPIDDAYLFVQEDRPEALARAIRAFVPDAMHQDLSA